MKSNYTTIPNRGMIDTFSTSSSHCIWIQHLCLLIITIHYLRFYMTISVTDNPVLRPINSYHVLVSCGGSKDKTSRSELV